MACILHSTMPSCSNKLTSASLSFSMKGGSTKVYEHNYYLWPQRRRWPATGARWRSGKGNMQIQLHMVNSIIVEHVGSFNIWLTVLVYTTRNSIYGCHVCSPNDYDWRYTPCESGKRTKVFFWKYNPKRCHGDLTLPPNSEELCRKQPLWTLFLSINSQSFILHKWSKYHKFYHFPPNNRIQGVAVPRWTLCITQAWQLHKVPCWKLHNWRRRTHPSKFSAIVILQATFFSPFSLQTLRLLVVDS